MNADTLLENFEILAEAPNGIDRIRELVLSLGTRIGFGVDIQKSPKQKLTEVSHVSWGNLSLTKTSYVEDGQFLAISAAGPDGRIGHAEHDKFTPVISAIGARCGTMFMPDEKFTAIKNTMTVTPDKKKIDNWYLYYALKGSQLPRRGTAQPFLSKTDIENFEITVPSSLGEQQIIVTKVDELMALCDQLEQQQKQRDNLRIATRKSAIDAISTATTPAELEAAWKRINNNWEVIADTPESVEPLRSLILSLAVLGKIVAQDPYEPTIFDELNNIDPKEVGEMLLPERQIETRLPSNWAYLGFRHIGRWVGGNGFPTDKQGGRDKEILFCKVSDMNLESNSKYIFETVNSLDLKTAKEMRVTPHAAGTVVFPKIGGAIATNKRRLLVKPTVIDNNCMGVSPSSVINPEWLYVLFRSIDLTKYQSGTSIPSISQRVLDEIRFGVPPRAEQKRIVKKVEELMALCDQLESELKSRSEVAEKFARSVVNAA